MGKKKKRGSQPPHVATQLDAPTPPPVPFQPPVPASTLPSPWVQVGTLFGSLLVATFTVGCIDYLVTGHIKPEPTRKGIFSMEITAFVLLLAAFVSDEVLKFARPAEHEKHSGLSARNVGLVLLSLAGSLAIYISIVPFIDE